MFEIERIVVVTKKTSLGELVYRLNSKSQAKFYLEQNQVSFSEYEQSDAQYQQAIQLIRQRLPRTIKQQFIDRDFLPTYQFGEHDLVLTVGPDGLVINTAKYLTTQPILAINPDPRRIDGILIPFTFNEIAPWLERTLKGDVPVKHISMVKATLNDGQTRAAEFERDHRLDRRGLHWLAALDHAGRVACRALLWRWHRYTACSGGYRARLGIRPPMVHGARTIPVQNIAGQHRLRANRPSPGAGNYLAHARLRCHFQRRHRKRLPRLQFRLYRPRWAGRTQGASDCATLSGLMLLPIIHEK